jgi:hypothetical protein
MFPTPLAILLYIAPESPWWLVRKGRLAEAEKAVRRLGRQGAVDNTADKVAMMQRTIELEKTIKKPNLVELWKGTDLYRTLIVCGVYASQNLTGNLIANQAVFFFKRESWQPIYPYEKLTKAQRLVWLTTPPSHLALPRPPSSGSWSCYLGFSPRTSAGEPSTFMVKPSTVSSWLRLVLRLRLVTPKHSQLATHRHPLA